MSDLKFHVYLLIDPTTELIRYVGQSRRDPWTNYYSRYFTECKHNNWLNNIIQKLKGQNLFLKLKIESWHAAEDEVNEQEKKLISFYRNHPQAKLVNVLDGGRKGWKSTKQWLRLRNDGMREVSKYVRNRQDLENIATMFLENTSKKSVVEKIGCTEQYFNQLIRGDLHIDLWEELPQLLDKVLAHADAHNISLGGLGGGSGTPRDDRPDDLIYKSFEMYSKGLTGHKIKEILDVGVNIYDVLNGTTRPKLLQRWIEEGNAPPDLTRIYEYQISDDSLYEALDLKSAGMKHEDIAQHVGCCTEFISKVIRGKIRAYIKNEWELKNGKLPKNNRQKRLDDSVGFLIFTLKYENGINENQIASQLNVSRQYVHKILKGQNKPHIKEQWEKEKGLRV